LKYRILISTASALAVVAIAFTVALIMPKNGDVNTDSTAMTQSTAAQSYTLKEYQGKLAVFTPESSQPQQIIDVQIQSLPQSEQDKLRDGIQTNDHDELLALIENYTS
jgi:hypothetical protein